MLESIDPAKSGIPRSKGEWEAFREGFLTLANGEIMTVAIDPEGWLEFQQAQKDGWQPTWSTRTLSADEEEVQAARMRELLAQSPLKRPRREG